MDLEIYRLFLEGSRNGTTGLARLSAHIEWDGRHCMFIGRACGAAELRACLDANRGEIEARGIQKLHFESPAGPEALEALGPDYTAKVYDRIMLARHPSGESGTGAANCAPALLADARALLEEGTAENLGALREEIEETWGGLGAFAAKGFGLGFLEDGILKGWCLSEYNSPGRCGIGIETVEAYRKRGIAKALTRGFCLECGRRGVTAYWDSWLENQASVGTALANGFAEVERYKAALVLRT